jgi:hypothetical protein
MNRFAYVSCGLILTLAGMGGCSSGTAEKDAKPARAPDRIQGKAQVLEDATTAIDGAFAAGGSAMFIWEGTRRYRLFMHAPLELEHGREYVAEGVYAQKAIDEIGDPEQGKNGYPLQSSCERVVKMAWTGLPFDVADGRASLLKSTVKRYPARPIFLVTRISPVSDEGKPAEAKKGAEPPEVSVAPEKQRAALLSGPNAQPAPLWQPAGGTAKCRVVIDTDGKVAELETGAQLCETVPWSEFRYQPLVQKGKPVKVRTEVEVKFDPRT